MKSLQKKQGTSALELVAFLEENKIPYNRYEGTRHSDFELPTDLNIIDTILCVDNFGQDKIHERFGEPFCSHSFSSGVEHETYELISTVTSLKDLAKEWMGQEYAGLVRLTKEGDIKQYTYLIYKKNGRI